MKVFKLAGYVALGAVALVLSGNAEAKKFYKMSTISLPTPFAINTTFVKLVQKYNPDIEIQVTASGAAPRHALDASKGKTDFLMGAPAIQFLMSKQIAMFKKVKNSKELSQNLRTIFN